MTIIKILYKNEIRRLRLEPNVIKPMFVIEKFIRDIVLGDEYISACNASSNVPLTRLNGLKLLYKKSKSCFILLKTDKDVFELIYFLNIKGEKIVKLLLRRVGKRTILKQIANVRDSCSIDNGDNIECNNNNNNVDDKNADIIVDDNVDDENDDVDENIRDIGNEDVEMKKMLQKIFFKLLSVEKKVGGLEVAMKKLEKKIDKSRKKRKRAIKKRKRNDSTSAKDSVSFESNSDQITEEIPSKITEEIPQNTNDFIEYNSLSLEDQQGEELHDIPKDELITEAKDELITEADSKIKQTKDTILEVDNTISQTKDAIKTIVSNNFEDIVEQEEAKVSDTDWSKHSMEYFDSNKKITDEEQHVLKELGFSNKSFIDILYKLNHGNIEKVVHDLKQFYNK